jgi:predicted dehydrogenase
MAAPDPIRLGLSGAGFVAQAVHLPLLRELHDRFRLVALAEPAARVRAAVQARYGFARAYAPLDELLAAGGLDALLVCSPNGTHASTTLAALDAGLHVLVEKPLCIDPADAARIAAAAEGAGRVVQVGTMKRFDPAYQRLLADLPHGEALDHIATRTYDPGLVASFAPADCVIDGPDAGDAERLLAATTEQVEAATGTREEWAVRAFSDVYLGALVHDVNLVHGILDAAGVEPGPSIDAAADPGGRVATAAIALPEGGRCTFAWLRLDGLGDFQERVEVLGPGGVRTLEFPAPYLRGAPTRYGWIRGGGGGWTGVASGSWQEPYVRQLVAFHAAVTEGEPCRTPPDQAARDVTLLAELFALALRRRTAVLT